ncbi:MAG: sigma-70 family RNA polymerase sigma factor [Flavobacteriales bacterium]|nr:MAG: sigma-70 family RNA polymerase sigma factor [Flavobacteriales bacterium]
MDEQVLIKHCTRGNRLAQRQLYEMHAGRLFAVCLRYLQREDAEEAHSNTWVKVFQGIDGFRGESKFSTWMTRIAVNECLMMLRRKNVFFSELDENAPTLQTEEHEESDTAHLLHLIANLPLGYRTVFNLYAIEGYSHKEIAEMLSINEGTSKSQLARARGILRNALEKNVFKI